MHLPRQLFLILQVKTQPLKKKFLTNVAFLLFLNLLVKTFWVFGIDRQVQNIVGTEEYGLYFSLLSLSIILNILLDVGITNFNNRDIARDHRRLTPNIARIVPLKFSLAVVYALFVLSTGLILGYSARQFSILLFLILNQFLLSFLLYLRSNLSGLHLFTTDAVASVIDRMIVIIPGSLLIWGNITREPFHIEWLVYIQTAAYVLGTAIILLIVLSKTKNLKLKFGFRNGFNILKKSYPFAILILLMSFFNRFDSVLMERILEDGKEQAGIYAHSFRILDAVNMYSVLIAGMLLPIFSRMLKKKQDVGGMVKLSWSLVFIPAISLVVISWFFNLEIIELLYTEHSVYSSKVYRILISGFLFISTSYIFGTLLTANRSLRQLNILAAITVVLNLVLNIVLIPHFKAVGAAIASLSAQAFFAGAQVIAAKKIIRLNTDPVFLLRVFLFSLSLFGVAYLAKQHMANRGMALLVICLASLFLSALFRILTPRAILSILREEEQ